MNPLIAQARGETPLGPVTLAATEAGLAGLWFDAQKHHPGELDAPVDATNPHIVAMPPPRWAQWHEQPDALPRHVVS